MKRKCKNCNTEFEFKVKDLKPKDTILNYSAIFIVQCPYCLTSKEIYYNYIPKHLKNIIKR